MKIKTSKGEIAFQIFDVLFMLGLIVVMFYPMWHVLCASFSDARQLSSHSGVLLWPDGYSLTAYKLMLKNPMIGKGYINTITILVCGLALNMLMTSIAAYVLSRKNVLLNPLFNILIIRYTRQRRNK